MQELGHPDNLILNAAIGWLELGNPNEAAAEHTKISQRHQDHPDVLDVAWRILAAQKNWPAALNISLKMMESMPENPVGWINRSYSLHEMKQTREAMDQLLPALEKFPSLSIIPYNMACYACQLSDIEKAKHYLEVAILLKGKDEIRAMALSDQDLQPMREFIERL